MINILFILYNFQKTLKTIKRYKCNLEHYRLSCILLRSIWEYVTSLCKDYNCSVLRINLWSSRPEFSVNGVLENFAKFTVLCRVLFFNKVAGACNFVKKENPTRVFFVNFAKFSRTPATLLKKRIRHRRFLWISRNFQEHHFYRTLQRATASVIYIWFTLRCKPQIVNYQVKCN